MLLTSLAASGHVAVRTIRGTWPRFRWVLGPELGLRLQALQVSDDILEARRKYCKRISRSRASSVQGLVFGHLVRRVNTEQETSSIAVLFMGGRLCFLSWFV